MNESIRRHVIVGVFVIVGSLSLAAALVLFAGKTRPVHVLDAETLIAESVNGLDVGAPVRFRGVKIGQVTEIGLANLLYDTDSDLVVVRFQLTSSRSDDSPNKIRRRIEQRIEHGLRIRLSLTGISGVAYLEMDIAPADAEIYPALSDERLYVPAQSSTLTSMLDKMQAALDTFNDSDFNGLVSSLKGTADRITAGVDELRLAERSAEVGELIERFDGLVTTLETDFGTLLGDARGAVGRIDAAAKSVGDAADSIGAVANAPGIARTIENVEAASASVARAAEGIEGVVGATGDAAEELRAAISQIRGAVIDARRLYAGGGRRIDLALDQIGKASANLNRLMAKLAKSPSSGLLAAPPPKRDLRR